MNRNTLAARALIAAIFIVAGVMKITGFQETSGWMASIGFPAPSLFLFGALVTEIGAGAALLLGYRTRIAAAALFAFLIPATLIFHVANLGSPELFQQELMNTLRNLSIMGGLLYVALDRTAERKAVENMSPARLDRAA